MSQKPLTFLRHHQIGDPTKAQAVETASTVLGHTSGEIAAAYATGIIEAKDAICVAYC